MSDGTTRTHAHGDETGGGPKGALAASVVALGVLSVLLAALAMGVAERSARAALLGGIEAVALLWPALLFAAGFLPVALDPVARLRRRMRRGDVFVLLAMIQAIWWVLTYPPLGGGGSRADAWPREMQTDLKNLASQQEIYHSDYQAYSATPSDLGFVTSNGVLVRIESNGSGWAATAEHESDSELACAIYWPASATPLPTKGGRTPSRPGEILCEPFPPFSGWGPIGRFLRAYHEALEDRRLVEL